MPKTYYDSELTGAQIESALEAIHGVVTPSNNGKVLYIEDGQIKAASASRWGHGAVLEPLSVTANGDYTPPTGTDGFDSVHVAVPGATLTTKSITQNGTYNASSDNADGYSSVTVDVQGGGSAVVQPLSVTQNGTYNPPSGVDGYAPVTVNVSGGGGDVEPTLPAEYQEVEYIDFDGDSYVTINSRYIQSGDVFETVMQYITNNTAENAALSTSITSSSPRFDIYFSSNQAAVYSANNISRGGFTQISSFSTDSYKEKKSVSLGDKLYVFLEINTFNMSNSYLRIGAYGGSYFYRNRLFKIKRSIVTSTLGDVSQSSYFNTHRTTYTWYKPCYRKADSVPGWYDTANDVFYTNEGTGAFVVGSDVN